MKICPICDETFDEEIIRFCTKDGTPLVDQAEPSFVELPSESLGEPEDDLGEITIIRRKDVPAPPPSIEELNAELNAPSERFVIPTTPAAEQNVRPRPAQVYYPPVEKPNTLKIVVLTVIGTVTLLALGAFLFSFLRKEMPANGNMNLNTNLGSFNGNLNSNANIDSNFNFNMNANFNSGMNLNTNFNANANLKTPTPTPKPSPSVTPTPGESPTPPPTPLANRVNTNTRLVNAPLPTPRIGPRPTASPARTPDN